MFNPIPPQSNQPAPEPADDASGDDLNGDDQDMLPEAAESSDLETPLVPRPSAWPAVVRWSRVCRVLAFLSLIYFGWGVAMNLYHLLVPGDEMQPFQRISPPWYFYYAIVDTVYAIAACLSLLGFAELLQLFMSIEASAREKRNPSPQPEANDSAA